MGKESNVSTQVEERDKNFAATAIVTTSPIDWPKKGREEGEQKTIKFSIVSLGGSTRDSQLWLGNAPLDLHSITVLNLW